MRVGLQISLVNRIAQTQSGRALTIALDIVRYSSLKNRGTANSVNRVVSSWFDPPDTIRGHNNRVDDWSAHADWKHACDGTDVREGVSPSVMQGR